MARETVASLKEQMKAAEVIDRAAIEAAIAKRARKAARMK